MKSAFVKVPIKETDLIMLEKASKLKIISEFEVNFIKDLTDRYRTYGIKMVITSDQRNILIQLSSRYDKVRIKNPAKKLL